MCYTSVVAYNLTDETAFFTQLAAARLDALAHLRPEQILHGVTQARTRSRYGVYAQCHALRFKDGARELVTRKWKFVWPEIRVRGTEVLYYVNFFVPRFLDQAPSERLRTLLHELHHISPKFNGDLRRFAGRNEFHGGDFHDGVERLAKAAEREIDLERFQFLRLSFDELVKRHGGVVGNKLKRFAPRRLPVETFPPKAPPRKPAAAPPEQHVLF